MSNLAKQLRAHDTGRRYAETPAIPALSVLHEVRETPELTKEVSVGIHLKGTVMVSDSLSDAYDENVFTDAIRQLKRNIVEQVFGEFRPIIFSINEAQHKRDWAEATRLTGKLYEQMFVEGV